MLGRTSTEFSACCTRAGEIATLHVGSSGGNVRGIWLIPALVAAVGVYAAIDDGSGLRSWLRLRSDLEVSRARIEGLRDDVAQLSKEAEALQNQTFALERAIREELEYTRPGETLVRLPRTTDRASE